MSPKLRGRASRQLSRGCIQLCQAAWHHAPNFPLHMDTELYGRRKLFFVQSYSQAFLIFLFFSDGNNYMNLRNGSQCLYRKADHTFTAFLAAVMPVQIRCLLIHWDVQLPALKERSPWGKARWQSRAPASKYQAQQSRTAFQIQHSALLWALLQPVCPIICMIPGPSHSKPDPGNFLRDVGS